MKNIKNIIEQKYPPENPNDLWMKNDVLYKSTNKGWMPLTAGGGSSNIIPITWQKLKDLRNSSKLIPGSLYRITDYQCTTTQENTKSANHQFDIVLLALSKNKLAEEGWAMEHSTDVYDVTFVDGITKKCYLYEYNTNDNEWNIVDVDTLTGITGRYAGEGEDIVINESNKTATCADNSTDLTEENLTYNYFQNSNLSAWKVCYCLDNDKSRFAWADDSVDEGTPAFITTIDEREGTIYTYYRYSAGDLNNLFAWKSEGGFLSLSLYTASQTPSAGDTIYSDKGHEHSPVNSFTPGHEGTGLPNGRGVIYRLIDEWNNNIPYDFKNILIHNETYSQYCYAIIDNTKNNFDVDPTLDGTKVKAIHVLCDNNDVLKPVAKGRFGNNPLVNIIFLNNNTLADECSNCVVSNGLPIVS